MSLFAKRVISPMGLWKKSVNIGGGLFKKGGYALDNASHSLKTLSNIAGSIHKTAGKILNSDVAKSLAHIGGPNGMVSKTHNDLLKANGMLGRASKVYGEAGEFANRRNYKGDAGDVAINMLERGRKIVNGSGAVFQ